MTTETILALVFLALIVGGALAYMLIAKKRGQKCIGCPYSKSCSGSCEASCGDCHCGDQADEEQE